MKNNSQRLIYLFIGWVFTALGFVGAFLPLLPTTPFLLIAVWAFSKSSPKLRRWLFTHPKFGSHIRNWFRHGAIDSKAKAVSLTFMGISIVISLFISENIYVPITLSLFLSVTAIFIITRPNPSAVSIKSQ